MKKIFFGLFLIVVLFALPKHVYAQFYNMTGDGGSKMAEAYTEMANKQDSFATMLEGLSSSAIHYYFLKIQGSVYLVILEGSGKYSLPYGQSGSEPSNKIIGEVTEDKIDKANGVGMYSCSVVKQDNYYKVDDCSGTDFFTWTENYGSMEKPGYEKTVGKKGNDPLSLKLEVVEDAGRWYAQFYSIVDANEKFIKLEQSKVHWKQGSSEGDDFNGKASLTINTVLPDGSMMVPGVQNLKFKVKQDFNQFGLKYIREQEKGVFLKINFDCSKQIPATTSCSSSTPEVLKECEKTCNNEYCEFKNGACVEKPEPTSGTEPPKSTYEYNEEYFKSQYPVPPGYNGALPPCAFSGTCRDVNNLVELIIRWASGFFAILGTFAFVFFVYGGFTILLSAGNPEKVKKGQQTLVAAVVGLFIAFSAYLAIDFMLDALDVNETFRGIK